MNLNLELKLNHIYVNFTINSNKLKKNTKFKIQISHKFLHPNMLSLFWVCLLRSS